MCAEFDFVSDGCSSICQADARCTGSKWSIGVKKLARPGSKNITSFAKLSFQNLVFRTNMPMKYQK